MRGPDKAREQGTPMPAQAESTPRRYRAIRHVRNHSEA